MAARTTDANVRLIIEADPKITELDPFIVMANELTTECCGSAGYSSTRLEMIERLLAAHFYTFLDPRVDSEKAGPVGSKYQYKIELGFNNTHHGQAALRLDTAGGLAALEQQSLKGTPTVVGVTWLGTSREELESTE